MDGKPALKAHGDCFRWAAQYAAAEHAKGDVVLVHGTVTHPWDGHKLKHAWVEFDGKVYDWQSSIGLGKWGRPISEWYEAWEPEQMQRYEGPAALALAAKHHHWGPWK